MYSDLLVSKLNDIAHRYRDLIHKSLHEVLSQPQYKNTGAGLASLTVDVIDGDHNIAPKIVIHFDDHLLLLDKRKMQWTQMPDMKNLLAWAATKKDKPSEIKKLAWSTAIQQQTNDVWKAKPWRKKSLGSVLKEMNEVILQGFAEVIDIEFNNATKIH